MTNGRPTPKSPGRTPPFILVGLLVMLCVLAYNYWTLSSKNTDLTAMTEKLRSEATSVAAAHESVQKSLDDAQEKLRATEGNLDQVRQLLKEKEAELENIQSDMSKLQVESSKCQEDLANCQSNVEAERAEVEKLKVDSQGEIANLKAQQCERERCTNEIKAVTGLLSRSINPASIKQALDNANLNSMDFMDQALIEQIANAPPQPDGQQVPNANANVQDPGNANAPLPDKVEAVNVDQAAPPNQPPVKDTDQLEGKTESTDPSKEISLPVEAAIAPVDPLVFQPDKNNDTEIKQMAKDEKENAKDAHADVVNQNIENDPKSEMEISASEADVVLETEDVTISTEEPEDEEN